MKCTPSKDPNSLPSVTELNLSILTETPQEPFSANQLQKINTLSPLEGLKGLRIKEYPAAITGLGLERLVRHYEDFFNLPFERKLNDEQYKSLILSIRNNPKYNILSFEEITIAFRNGSNNQDVVYQSSQSLFTSWLNKYKENERKKAVRKSILQTKSATQKEEENDEVLRKYNLMKKQAEEQREQRIEDEIQKEVKIIASKTSLQVAKSKLEVLQLKEKLRVFEDSEEANLIARQEKEIKQLGQRMQGYMEGFYRVQEELKELQGKFNKYKEDNKF